MVLWLSVAQCSLCHTCTTFTTAVSEAGGDPQRVLLLNPIPGGGGPKRPPPQVFLVPLPNAAR